MHMEAHAHPQEAITRLSKACAARGYTANPRAPQTSASPSPPSLSPQPTALPAGDVLVSDSQQAVAAVQTYLAPKPWGYFGATCGSSMAMHYPLHQGQPAYMPRANESDVGIPRDP